MAQGQEAQGRHTLVADLWGTPDPSRCNLRLADKTMCPHPAVGVYDEQPYCREHADEYLKGVDTTPIVCPRCGGRTDRGTLHIFGECQTCLGKTWAWWYK